MEDRNEPKYNKIKADKEINANSYLRLAGIFLIAYAFIYVALLLRVHFLSVRSGISAMSELAANLIFASSLFMLSVALYLYMVFSRRELMFKLKEAGALLFIFTIVTIGNIYFAYLNSYSMLVALTALLTLPFGKKRDAFLLNTFSCLISSFSLVNMLDSGFTEIVFTAIAGILSGAVAVYAFPSAMTRFSSILRAFLTVLSAVAVYLVFLSLFSLSIRPFVDNVIYIVIAAGGQMLVTVFFEPVIEAIFNITTDFRLVELTNHKRPLIHRLIVEAPGTFNHSLAVANFAEICADAIGEDPILARACAYYHDVGKLNNAMYFTENQAGYNPHDELLPEVSAEIIRQHTTDGLELCRSHRIPEEIARVTVEHHGTLPIMFFYNKAKSLTDSEVDMEEYRYHGDTPTTKIAAIIMICDSSEAAIRAMEEPDGEKVDKLLKNMIDERMRLGQFDDCPITMQDLNTIRSAIVGAYGGLFHKRIKYNNGKRDAAHV